MAASDRSFPGMRLGQILDRIFQLLWANLGRFGKLAIVPCAALLACYALIGGAVLFSGILRLPAHTVVPPQTLLWIVPVVIAGLLLVMLAYPAFEAAATYTAIQANSGVAVDFQEAYGLVQRRFKRLLWLMILRWLVVGGPVMAPFALVGGLTALAVRTERGELAPGVWFLLFPLICLLFAGVAVYAVLMMLRLSLAPAACVAEDVGAVRAMKRSGQLTRNAKGRIFVVLLVVYAAGYIAMMLVELVCMAMLGTGAVAATVLRIHFVAPWNYLGVGLLTVGGLAILILWMAAVWSSSAVAFAVLYDDQRSRTASGTAGPPPAQPC